MLDLRNGQRLPLGPFFATIYPDDDYETYSEAGFVWQPPEHPAGEWVWKPHKATRRREVMPSAGEWLWKPWEGKWGSLPGLSDQMRGLKAVGTRNYVTHPSFRVLCFAYDLKDGRGRHRWRPIDGIVKYPWRDPRNPLDLLDYVRDGGIIESWNVMFEWSVWNFHCVPVYGWPELPVEQLRCCMAKSRASGYPGALDDFAKVKRLSQQKDAEGARIMRKLTTPRNPTKTNPELRWTPATVPEEFERLYAYNEQDIATEAEASSTIPDLSPFELSVWQTDFRINARGMQIDLRAVEDCIAIVEQAFAKYNAELSGLTGGAVQHSTEVAKTLAWLSSRGIFLGDKLDEEAVEEALKREYPPDVLRVLKIRQILAFGSVRKLYAMRSHSTPEGRLCDQYVYYGAAPGLWNGRAVQPANLYSGEWHHPDQVALALAIISTRKLDAVEAAYGDALEAVANCLRSMIVAAPGCRLLSADFTAIQAVILAALAGEEWVLEVFRTHGKIYETQASLMTGKPFQFYIDYKIANKKHHPDRQDWGKLPILSGGFAAWIGGWKRFGADKILGADENIKAAILKYRGTVPNTVEFWGGQTRNKFNRDASGAYAEEYAQFFGLEGAAIKAVSNYILAFGEGAPKGIGQAEGYRSIGYQVIDDILYCIPPGGGLIRYHAPRLARSMRDYASPWEVELSYEGWNSNASKGAQGWQRMKLYGGVLTQNVVSHVARQVQAHALLRLEAHGYPVVMHTHDENVVELPFGHGSIEEYTRLVRILPDWAKDEHGRPWPINVPDAWEHVRYGKWEF